MEIKKLTSKYGRVLHLVVHGNKRALCGFSSSEGWSDFSIARHSRKCDKCKKVADRKGFSLEGEA